MQNAPDEFYFNFFPNANEIPVGSGHTVKVDFEVFKTVCCKMLILAVLL